MIIPIIICDCDKNTPTCYTGKVIALNKGNGCNNILSIIKTPDNGELVSNSTITFDPDLFQANLEYGDVISFSIISYENWKWISNTACLIPQYAAIIEPCSD